MMFITIDELINDLSLLKQVKTSGSLPYYKGPDYQESGNAGDLLPRFLQYHRTWMNDLHHSFA